MSRIPWEIRMRSAVLAILAASAVAGESVPPRLAPGAGRALWERVQLGETVLSDFAVPEPPAPIGLAGSRADALAAQVAQLQAEAPCTMREEKSALGDEQVVLENGLVRVAILPAYGGRIIAIANRATGANIFLDNYSRATAKPAPKKGEVPGLLGGWIEAPDNGSKSYWDTPHRVEVTARGDQAVTLTTTGEVAAKSWGVEGNITVRRTIGLERGSARVRLDIELVNHSQGEREMRFRPQVRHALGGDPQGDEFWLSSLGRVTHAGPDHEGDWFNSLRCEEGLDTWQGIIDRQAREGVVVLPRGEIGGRMCIYGLRDKKTGQRWYTYENTSTLREHVVEGVRLAVGHDYAPVLNLDALTFADAQVAVEFVPGALHVAPGRSVPALLGAAALATGAVGTLRLVPVFRRDGRELARGAALEVEAGLLVARPRLVDLPIPEGLPPGACELAVEVVGHGVFRQQLEVAPRSGAFLAVLRGGDDGHGAGLSVNGAVEAAQVVVERAGAEGAAGSYRLGELRLPFTTSLTPLPGALRLVHEVDLARFPADARLQSLGLAFPLRLSSERSRPEVAAGRLRQAWQRELVVTIGGAARDEQYLVNQSCNGYDFRQLPEIPTWALSDDAERWPVWRLGGILQLDARTAWTWKAAGHDVPLLPVVQEPAAAGWLDVHSRLGGTGVLVVMPGMARRAPVQLAFDGGSGHVLIHAFPPQAPAMGLRKAGTAGRSPAEEWGLDAQGKVRFEAIICFHRQVLAEWLAGKGGNRAEAIRRMVAAGDYAAATAVPATAPGF